MSTSNFDKFLLLLWKNWVTEWNYKIQVAMEMALPAIFSLLSVLLRILVLPKPMDAVIYNQSFPIDNLDMFQKFYNKSPIKVDMDYRLAYSPNTNEIFENIVHEAAASLQLPYVGYSNSKTLEIAVIENQYFAGIEFSDSLANITSYPRHLSYRLRFPSELRTALASTWQTDTHFAHIEHTGPRNVDDSDGGVPSGYLREGFLAIQNAISTQFIKQSINNRRPLPRIFLRRYPYPKYVEDRLLSSMTGVIAVVILQSYIYPCAYTVKCITSEKEKQLKEVMKIMGLQNWLHWTAWFAKTFIMMAMSSVLIVVVLKIKWLRGVAVLANSSFSAVLLFLLIFSMSSITFCFMFSTFFSKASTAAAVTGMLWFISYIPYTYFRLHYSAVPLTSKLFWCLLSNTAMGLGVHMIVNYEADGIGLQWSNILKQRSIDDSMSMSYVLGMMCLSSFLQMTICLYMEQIYPGEIGLAKDWNFPFQKKFWFKHRKPSTIRTSSHLARLDSTAFEYEPLNKVCGVEVRNLSKNFGKVKAVNDVTMDMYEDEITVLLGRNGAGKTTMISMLIGLFPPSSGTAAVNGYDITTDPDGARYSMSICPQHNILFDNLTVKDHLIFYSRLKGLKGQALEEEVTKYIKKIDLEKKADVESVCLSGGLQRKLSVCAALCGGTKVVLCDEPSSGMDPAARRQLWDLLQSERTGRTMLLTTHFMEEADVLADRIAILCNGELKCLGSPFFLKKRYGSGYRLICAKKNNCDTERVTQILEKYIPEIQPAANVGAELTYELPESYSGTFEQMLNELERNSQELGLDGFGISVTTIEDVFLRVSAEEQESSDPSQSTPYSGGLGGEEYLKQKRCCKCIRLIINHWRAMLFKKYLYTVHNKTMFVIQNIMPIIFVSFTILVTSADNDLQQMEMTFSLNHYPQTVSIVETTRNVKFGTIPSKITENYRRIVESYGSSHKLKRTGPKSFMSYILELGKNIQPLINRQYIVAATVDSESIVAWFNNKPLHSAPLSVNLIHNAMARSLIGRNARIVVTNAPVPYSKQASLLMATKGVGLGTHIAVNLGSCMSLICALYCMFLIKERESRAKLLQLISGVKGLTFWLSHFFWDYLTFTVTAIVAIITLACFREQGYETVDELSRNFALILTFGSSALPLVYLMSEFFMEPAIGFARMAIVNIFLGSVLFIFVLIISKEDLKVKQIADDYEKFFLISPHFALVRGLNNLFINTRIKKLCAALEIKFPETSHCQSYPECCKLVPFFSWEPPGVLPQMTYLSYTSLVFLDVLMVKHFCMMDSTMRRITRRFSICMNHFLASIGRLCWCSQTELPQPAIQYDVDDDVVQEQEMVRNLKKSERPNYRLVINSITKYYANFLAVDHISVAVKNSECFGLLGVTGAGKTTIFKMLTGDTSISSGNVYVNGLNMMKNTSNVYKNIGYCPQFDALFDEFTGRETLKIFGLLRGIPSNVIREVSEDLATSFDFMSYYNKKVGTYSGGNKRKLSTAIAVIGSPSVVYLDEPTTGMDPAARRQFWNIMCRLRDSGKSIVLTSCSMEECEALCTRLAIMVNGGFKCLGSTQHLRIKFATGLVLKIKLGRAIEPRRQFWESAPKKVISPDEKVITFIKENFPDASLQDKCSGLMTFHIPMSAKLWSRIFGLMEKNKTILSIEDYSITQTTLEEIFLQLVKDQEFDSKDTKRTIWEILYDLFLYL